MNNRLQFHGKVYYFFRSDVLTVRGLVHLPYLFYNINYSKKLYFKMLIIKNAMMMLMWEKLMEVILKNNWTKKIYLTCRIKS